MGIDLPLGFPPGVLNDPPDIIMDGFDYLSSAWVSGDLSTNTNLSVDSGKLIITRSLGPELLLNGNFATWVGGNPGSWSMTGETGSTNEISEVGPGEGHGGAGNGLCNFYTQTGSPALGLWQQILTAQTWYQGGFTVDTRLSGAVGLEIGAATTWFFPSTAPGERTDHPTSKPVELFAIPMLQHTRVGDICYEPFSGSGSQHVAGEQNGRLVYGLELAPEFCAVILERLSGLGLEPQLVEGEGDG